MYAGHACEYVTVRNQRVESSAWTRGLRRVEKEESEKHTVATLNEANTLVMRRPVSTTPRHVPYDVLLMSRLSRSAIQLLNVTLTVRVAFRGTEPALSNRSL